MTRHLAKLVPLDSFSLREKVAAGRMRVNAEFEVFSFKFQETAIGEGQVPPRPKNNGTRSPSPRPSPAGRGNIAKCVPLDTFSLREKVAAGRMRVKRRMVSCKGHYFIARLIFAAVAFAGLTKPSAELPEPVQIGMEGSLFVVLPGEKLEAAPVGDKSKIILRIHDIFPHGSDHRYDLRYFGFVPGEYDLAKFLRNADGTVPTNLPPITVRIHGILPEDHDGMLIEDETGNFSLPGSYTAWLIGLGVVWLLAAWPLFLLGRKKKTPLGQAEDEGPDLAERLRPLVEQAAAGTLDIDGRARLERMIFSYWREQLGLPEDGDLAELHQQLKAHDEAGPLLRGLEDWLHRPPDTATVDIPTLLEPYRRATNNRAE